MIVFVFSHIIALEAELFGSETCSLKKKGGFYFETNYDRHESDIEVRLRAKQNH